MRLASVALLCLGCQTLPAAVAEPPRQVEIWGNLRRLMHEGETGPAVALERIVPGPRAYAVGALSELRGEVTIIDDVVFLAYPGAGKPRVERGGAGGESAALLVVARVPAWSEWRVEADVPFGELDRFIETLAVQNGYDVGVSLPVLIDGRLADVHWHVIDGSREVEASDSAHGGHAVGADRGIFNGRGAMVGFFSKRHQGVFTHHGSNSHFHLVSGDGRVSGHVDHAVVPAGAVVRLPKLRRGGG